MSFKTVLLLICVGLAGLTSSCGVKGDPLPPTEPPTLGRGYPTYSNTIQRLNQSGEPSDEAQKENDSNHKSGGGGR